MIHIPVLRWGEPYKSLDIDKVVHFDTGEAVWPRSAGPTAAWSSATCATPSAPATCCAKSPSASCSQMIKKAADLYTDGRAAARRRHADARRVRASMQSATTGLPEHMCRFNMKKNHFVLNQMDKILDSLTRGLDLDILSRGYGVEARGVPVSYQAQSPVLGMVLPSNSPGVHTLWLPIIPMQVGLVLKPGPQEPWTPYRMAQAFVQAGIPKQAIAIYPGLGDVGAAVLQHCQRSLIFGGTATVEQYKGNPRVQAHGPGFSKILLGDDVVDNWPKYLDMMVDSVFVNSGRGCINCSGVWASRHTKEIAEAHRRADRPDRAAAAGRPQAGTGRVHGAGPGRRRLGGHREGPARRPARTHMTAKYGPRLVKKERCDYLRPTVAAVRIAGGADREEGIHVPLRDRGEVPAGEDAGGDRADAGVHAPITEDAKFQRQLIDATHIDRLNLGPIPTIKLNWLQPHEGNIVDFLFRARAFQHEGPVLA